MVREIQSKFPWGLNNGQKTSDAHFIRASEVFFMSVGSTMALLPLNKIVIGIII